MRLSKINKFTLVTKFYAHLLVRGSGFVIIIIFESLDANKEKELRSALKSEMQRYISQDDLLIFDGGNYIKGEFVFDET